MATKVRESKYVLTSEDRTAAAFASLERRFRSTERALGQIRNLTAGAFSVAGLVAFVNKNAEAERAANRLTAVISAQGNAAGFTRRQLDDMAESMAIATQFDDESIRNGQAQLLKFGNIYDDVFSRAMQLSADLAAFQGTELAGGIEAVGKALQNPAEGLKALEAQIGKLDPRQKEIIKNLVAQNRVTEAQTQLLDILQGKIGGTAQLMNTGYSRAISGVTKQWDEFLEALGKTAPVQSLVQSFFGFLEQSLKDMKSIIETGDWFAGLLFLLGGRGHITGGDEIEKRLGSYRKQLEALRGLLKSSNLTPDQKRGVGDQIKDLEARIATEEESLRMARRAATQPKVGSGLKPTIEQAAGKTTTKSPIGEPVRNLLGITPQFLQAAQTAQQFGQAELERQKEQVAVQKEIADLKNESAAFEKQLSFEEMQRQSEIGQQARDYLRGIQEETDLLSANARQRQHIQDMRYLEFIGLKEGMRDWDTYREQIVKAREAQDMLNRSWEHGAKRALHDYLDTVRNVSASVEGLVTRAFSNMEDAIVEFVRTGKLSFRSLAESIVEDLIRIQVQQSITGPLASIIGSTLASFGIGVGKGKAIPNAEHFATGGSFMVGGSGGVDTTPVAFMATRGERVTVETPGQQRAHGGVTIVQHVHIEANADKQSILMGMLQAKEAAKAEIRNEFYRGGRVAAAAGTR